MLTNVIVIDVSLRCHLKAWAGTRYSIEAKNKNVQIPENEFFVIIKGY